MRSHEDQVISLLNKIKSLAYDRERIIRRVSELWSHITPKLDTKCSSLIDDNDAQANNESPELKVVETQDYLLSGLINILEILKKDWDSHLNSLKNAYADIIKFL